MTLQVEYRVSNYAGAFTCNHAHRTLGGALRCARWYLHARGRPDSIRGPIMIVGKLERAAVRLRVDSA